MVDTGENRRLLKNTFIIAIGSIGAKAISFILLPLYTSILTSNEYGDYDYIITVTSFVIPIITLSMQEAIFRYLIDENNESEFRNVISNAFFIQLVGCILFIIIAYVISLFININYLLVMILCSITTSFSGFTLKILRGLGKLKVYSIISFLGSLVLLVTNVITITLLHMGINGLFFALVLSNIFIIIAVSMKINLFAYIKFKFINPLKMKDMLKYSIPLIPNTLSTQILALSDRLIIKQSIGSSANGIYTVSNKFPSIIEVVYHYFYLAWCESAARVYNKEKSTSCSYYNELYKTIKRFMFSSVIVIIACMPILFRILVKGNYTSAFFYVPLLMLGIYFNSTGRYLSGIFTAYKDTKQVATSTFITAAINISINILLVPQYGLYMAAASNLLSNYLLVFIRTIMLKKYIKFSSDFKFQVSAILITAVTLLLYNYDNWKYIICGIIITSIYFIVVNIPLISTLKLFIKRKIMMRKTPQNL